MQAVGIIAEYNPFHNGHKYQLEKAKECSDRKFAVVVMSGDFVQRGEAALYDKRLRAKEALLNGADMVLELPAPFAMSCAERFAAAGVGILAGTGIVDAISFGSECASLEKLRRGLEEDKEAIRLALDRGLSPAAARSGDLGPNDILGIEYLRAVEKQGLAFSCYPLLRRGAMHDGASLEEGFCSASRLREKLKSGKTVEGLVPDSKIFEHVPLRDMKKLSPVLLYALRSLSREELALLPEVSEGLENPIYTAARKAASYEEFLRLLKSRRYTMARLRRIAMSALLKMREADSKDLSGLYIRVLGLRKDAMSLLSEMGKKASLPLITAFKDVKQLEGQAARIHALNTFAAETAVLAGELRADFDYAAPLLIV